MDSCIFCNIIAGTIPSQKVYEDENVIVIPDISPQAPVHLLVVPKQHVKEFIDVPTGLITHIMTVAKKVIEEQRIESYRLVNNGKNVAIIDHFHLHILGNVDKYRKL
jgi:histidine triad (HIT) family protein